ncbi:MAG: hypothetical protein P9M07_05545 [Candidatus Aceula meridiana]|nr:hypothetical protein [Candidatus Aceula meridiana]
MKKNIIIVVVSFMVVLLSSQSVFAHPPVRIDLSYDAATKIVTAVIVHPVRNPDQHYINKIDVSINDKEVIGQQISFQETPDTQTVSYRLPDIKAGDIIGVEGYCNINGKLEKTIEAK